MEQVTKQYTYQITLIPDETGYTVLVPVLPGCVSYGETLEEATTNAKEAIALHLENLIANNDTIPEEPEPVPVLTALIHVSPSNV